MVSIGLVLFGYEWPEFVCLVWSCFRFLLLGDISLLFRLVLVTFLSIFLSRVVVGSTLGLVFSLISVLGAFGWRSWHEAVSSVVVGLLSSAALSLVGVGLLVSIVCLGVSLISLISHICNSLHHLFLISAHDKPWRYR